ncbi:hypothetical protein KC331_g2551 [Hortaea werneckii]|nr:hypothetical protein KC331_g2551 [Hortaea werneckii]KAI7722021.1 hypothetical protein KC353_g866 [Hortaea werneckii]
MTADRGNTVGFIGLGAMGHHMLNNLITRTMDSGKAKFNFAVFDVNSEAMDNVEKRHQSENPETKLIKCSSPAEIAQNASIIISMVPTGKHVCEVYLGDHSVMTALKSLSQEESAATLCLDQSTIEQSVSKDVALAMRAVGADMLDAPVSGGVFGAENGTLAIMCGGSDAAFKTATPVLQAMAREVTHCGDLGTGLAAKIANNMLLGITMAGLSEAMLLGKRLGLEPQVLANIINKSTGACWSSKVNMPVPGVKVGDANPPSHRGYKGGFVTKLAHKDLALAVTAAETAGSPLIVGKCVEEAYRPLAKDEDKWGNRDFSVMYEALENAYFQ